MKAHRTVTTPCGDKYEVDVLGRPVDGTPATICYINDMYPATVVGSGYNYVLLRDDNGDAAKGRVRVFKWSPKRDKYVEAEERKHTVTRGRHTHERTTFRVKDGGPSAYFGSRTSYIAREI